MKTKNPSSAKRNKFTDETLNWKLTERENGHHEFDNYDEIEHVELGDGFNAFDDDFLIKN